MLRERARLFRSLLFLIDLLLTVLSFGLSYQLYPITSGTPFPKLLYACFFILLIWSLLLKSFRIYHFSLLYTFSAEIRVLSKTVLAGGIILGSTLFIIKEQEVSRQFILWFLLIDFVCLLSTRLAIRSINGYLRKRGKAMRNIVLVGDDERALQFAHLIESTPWWGFNLLGFVTTEKIGSSNTISRQYDILGKVEDLPHLVTKMVVDEVVFVVPRKSLQGLEEIFPRLEEVGINTRIALNFFPHVSASVSISNLGDVPMISFSTTPGDGFPLLLKDLIDRCISFLLLLLMSPLMTGIAFALKLCSPGPVFVRQVRCGLHGRRFTMLTFRSSPSLEKHEQRSSYQHAKDYSTNTNYPADSECTFIEKWLGKSGADHLPLFFSILKGHMSLVGPRPHLVKEVDQYKRWQRRRLSMKPGLTGLWHINPKESSDARQNLEIDLDYIDNWHLRLDFKILLKSLPTILY
jgi:exopolysaccharide biosynthesis polyprenyl glycosylphosphotransferase